jgi:hypothetical protein
VTQSTRLLIGIATLVLAAVGSFLAFVRGDNVTGGTLIRVSLLLGSVWLVAPLLRRPGPATLVGLAAAAVVVIRPRLIIAIVAGAVIWRYASRSARRAPD